MPGASEELENHLQLSKLLNAQGDIIAEKVGGIIARHLQEMHESIEPTVRRAFEEILETKAAEAYANGLVQGVRMLLTEDKDASDGEVSTIKRFWKTGYRELTTAASANASQWVGRKILIALISAAFLWSMVWLVKNGQLK
jgi:hypothetical protein